MSQAVSAETYMSARGEHSEYTFRSSLCLSLSVSLSLSLTHSLSRSLALTRALSRTHARKAQTDTPGPCNLAPSRVFRSSLVKPIAGPSPALKKSMQIELAQK